MKNDLLKITDVDEGVDEVSFTLVNDGNKVIRITVGIQRTMLSPSALQLSHKYPRR